MINLSIASDDEIWNQWQLRRAMTGVLPLTAAPATIPSPEAIPPREWLYGTRLIRRFVTVMAAPGGVGKSALALAQSVAIATGTPFLGERVHHAVPVWMLNLEDPMDELHRRLAALLRLHNIAPASLQNRLFLHSGRARRVVMAAFDEAGGIAHPDRAAMIAGCQAHRIGLVVVDPFVKSHCLDENSNVQMDSAATAWAEIAEATGAAILLVHHVRKGSAAGGDVEITRGAKSLTDAARAAFLLAPMSADEAEHFAIPARDRWRYVRLDDAKANMAPRGTAARWFRMETVALGNATEAYPAGDSVGAVTAWKPPSPLGDLSPVACNRLLDLIAAGPGNGMAFSAHRTGKGGRWAGQVLMRECGMDQAEAARALATWLASGVLIEASYRDPAQRKSRMGVRVIDAHRPTVSGHETTQQRNKS